MAAHIPTADQAFAHSDALFQSRSPHEPHWNELRDFIAPSGAGFTTMDAKGAQNRDRAVESTAEQASERLRDGVQDMVTNPATRWLNQKLVDRVLDDDGKVWIEDSTDRQLQIFASPKSRFQIAAPQAYFQWLVYGTACMFIGDRPGKVPLYTARPLAQIAIGEDDEERVNQLSWKFTYTADAAFRRWGAMAGLKVATAAMDPKTAFNEFEFRHLVRPRHQFDPTRRDNLSLRFESLWLGKEDKTLVAVGGYPEFPYVVPRFAQRPGERYGRGVGSAALKDVKMLQRIAANTIQSAEKAILPPLMEADDGVMGRSDLRPAARNRVSSEWLRAGKDPIKAIQLGVRPDIGNEFTERVVQAIEKAFKKRLLELERDPRMTATQVLAIEEERLRGQSPMVGLLEIEFLAQTHERTFNITLRNGGFAPLPASLSGAEIRAEFVSQAARAQRLGEARAIAQRWDIMAIPLQADPTLLEVQDMDATYREVGRILGVPARLDRPPERVAEIRSQRLEAAARAEQVDQAASLMAAAGKGAPALPAIQDAAQQAGLLEGAGGVPAEETENLADAGLDGAEELPNAA